MIVLDTNVLSELMRHQPDRAVLEWVNARSDNELSITAITVAEILYGIERLADGKRKDALHDTALEMFEHDFSGPALSFDAISAIHYAKIVAARERIGAPISMADAQIAAICQHHDAILATRNVRDFTGTGVKLINPWETPS